MFILQTKNPKKNDFFTNFQLFSGNEAFVFIFKDFFRGGSEENTLHVCGAVLESDFRNTPYRDCVDAVGIGRGLFVPGDVGIFSTGSSP